MNAIVLTAVLSALNSGLYASSRMLLALARKGDAPAAFSKLSGNGVPVLAILVGTVFGYVSVIMSYISPETVFAFLVSSYGTVAIFVYVLIAISQFFLRRRLERENPERLRVKMWAFPYLTYSRFRDGLDRRCDGVYSRAAETSLVRRDQPPCSSSWPMRCGCGGVAACSLPW